MHVTVHLLPPYYLLVEHGVLALLPGVAHHCVRLVCSGRRVSVLSVALWVCMVVILEINLDLGMNEK